MKPTLVYDLSTRVFHWIFAGLFVSAFLIAKTVDDDSPTFSFHMLAGLTLGFAVILRLILAFAGSKYARFSSFALNPTALLKYFRGIFTGEKTFWAGHNPASSWAAILMLSLSLGLGLTGFLMTSGPNKETFEDIHELLANGFLITAILHVSGVILHSIRYRDPIGLSMLHGKKNGITAEAGIQGSQPARALALFVMLVAFSSYLMSQYNSVTRSLNFFGTHLSLGEQEEKELEGATSQPGKDTQEDDED